MSNMWSDNRSRMWKPLSPVKLILTFLLWFLRESKIEQISWGEYSLQKSMVRWMCKFTNAWTLFCFLVKCIILVFLGVLTIGIQSSYILQDMNQVYLIRLVVLKRPCFQSQKDGIPWPCKTSSSCFLFSSTAVFSLLKYTSCTKISLSWCTVRNLIVPQLKWCKILQKTKLRFLSLEQILTGLVCRACRLLADTLHQCLRFPIVNSAISIYFLPNCLQMPACQQHKSFERSEHPLRSHPGLDRSETRRATRKGNGWTRLDAYAKQPSDDQECFVPNDFADPAR